LPNWCENSLTISGPKDSVSSFVKKAEGREHKYAGPFSYNLSRDSGELEPIWEGFLQIQMEVLMKGSEDTLGETSLLSFHSLLPIPKEVLFSPYDSHVFEKMAKKYPEWFSKYPDLKSGYEWENSAWGVKWGATGIERDGLWKDRDLWVVKYHFSTAWNPPTLFQSVSEDFPDLLFSLEWKEPGQGFSGYKRYRGGLIVEESEWEWDEEESSDMEDE